MCAIASSFLASHGRLQAECNTLLIPAAFCVDGARLFRKALRSDNHLIGRALWYTHREFPSRDRKSTRLNSSHLGISYAVFCLKKKKKHKSEYHITKANVRHYK